jgi:hypothetical protein
MKSHRLRPLAVALALFSASARAETIQATGRDLRELLASAPPHAVIQCDPRETLVLTEPLRIGQPLTLIGLHARLPEKLGRTSLLVIEAPGVAVLDFELTGNARSVPQDQRTPLMKVHAGDFRIERGRFNDSTKDGVEITSGPDGKDIVGGVVRDIVGRGVIRDTVSISGGNGGPVVRHVLVDNVRAYRSELRGAVEVSDGSDNITVRKVYAEECSYAIDVQDHKKPGQVNRHIVIEDVLAVRCKQAIVTNSHAHLGHFNVTVRDATAVDCAAPFRFAHIANLQLLNLRIAYTAGVTLAALPAARRDEALLNITHCRGVTLRDVVVEGPTRTVPAVLLEDCDEAAVDGIAMRRTASGPTHAVVYRLAKAGSYSGLRIANVRAGPVDGGIVLERVGKEAVVLTDYRIVGNLAVVTDRIRGARGVVTDNLPSETK